MMWPKFCILIYLTVLSFQIIKVHSLFEYTNIKCNTADEDFATLDYCFIKSLNRSFKYISLRVKLRKVPVQKVQVNMAMLKRLNGYKPFLYNFTFDGCRYMANPYNPVTKYFVGLFQPYSNINHTCPYDHDIIVDKLPSNFLNNQFTKVLPFPEGDYALFTSWFAYNVRRIEVNVYFRIS